MTNAPRIFNNLVLVDSKGFWVVGVHDCTTRTSHFDTHAPGKPQGSLEDLGLNKAPLKLLNIRLAI